MTKRYEVGRMTSVCRPNLLWCSIETPSRVRLWGLTKCQPELTGTPGVCGLLWRGGGDPEKLEQPPECGQAHGGQLAASVPVSGDDSWAGWPKSRQYREGRSWSIWGR